ncbi:MAG: adenylyltransferase/cytidyltransferase family protein [Thermoplasmata archaeon]|nr:adenylyltransferase/cytidyltransferase family protein [Thermoplasmata archaeon]
MVRVMATGVFDLIHLGHLHFLEAAKALGDELVVVVANDATVKKQKHDPINPAEARAKIVAGLKPVDRSMVGGEGDPLDIVMELKPDLIVLGYDQVVDEEELVASLSARGLYVDVARLTHYDADLDGTRKIILIIEERLAKGQFYREERG